MTQLPAQDIYAFQRRATEIQVDVTTSADPGDLSSITFRAGSIIEVTGLSAESGGNGLLIDVSLTDDNLDVLAGSYVWELVATVGGDAYTLARGWLIVDPEPTESP